ncbi:MULTISPECIES: S-layer family protein [unclassified Nodularia (in: cyanobacteria)]|uniref:two-partner secretion domain-containing protein n=1 Tax=unclassified Nodularia (in: cyanobacteria) TaxID=2656917 RepID=UPI00187F8E18|nr:MULTISPECIES: S-layer family protein [unclassified Nodularia (in: cyanobacteria)]MBE9200502.1 S-layer family protein [Nodularia sp. LEGE 06071]MCC2691210.1 S-layer family protein [Nodularia sp. LEGE 04288]
MMRAALAQVISDDTNNTIVNHNGNNFTIINGIEKGNNLFHSFSNFSVPTGGSAIFNLTNTPNITTIFSRVTGENISHIDGLIQTLNSNNPVDLFLMNPNGIMFGRDAKLDIGGSFVGTTANSIKFADGTEFSAVNGNDSPLLTMSVPVGLQLGNSTSQIQVQGYGNDSIVPSSNLGIVASPGKTIALVGGDITFTGGVITGLAGRIEVGAVGSGTVNLTPTPAGWQLGYAQVENFRDIKFTQSSSLWNPDPLGNPFGGIQVVGRDITLDQSQIAAATVGTGQGGNITVNAERSLFLGGVNPSAQAPSAWIVNQVTPGATGNGGAVKIQAGDLTLQDGAAIETLSLGAGAAGKVEVVADTIAASGVVALQTPFFFSTNVNSRIASQVYRAGNGGDVSVVARKLILEDGASVRTTVFPGATGQGGNVSLDVADEIDALRLNSIGSQPSGINALTFGIGNGGNIRVSSGKLNLIDGGTISTITSRLAGVPGTGIGNAGDITLVVGESSNLVGVSPISSSQNSFIGSLSTGFGNTGNVLITTPILSIQDGATLGVLTVPVIGGLGDPNQFTNLGSNGSVTLNVSDRFIISGINPINGSSSVLNSINYSSAKPGEVTITTNQLLVLDGGIISNSTVGTGDAGTLRIQANDILIDGENNFAAIVANASLVDAITRNLFKLPDSPTGNTGVIHINTQQLTLRNRGFITVTHQGIGDAGELNIQANRVSLNAGAIAATTASGKGGNINLVSTNTFFSRNGSQINVEAGRNGDGGNININAPVIVGLENSDIIANALNGDGGNIQISTQGLFGLKFRDQLTPESDITASSQFGVKGTVNINNFGIDPNSGLVELPDNINDSSQQIATGCTDNQGSSFVATGRGGVPQNPNQQVWSDRTWSDIRDLSTYRQNSSVTAQIPSGSEVLKQATSWRMNPEGKIELVANKASTQTQLPLTCAATPKG